MDTNQRADPVAVQGVTDGSFYLQAGFDLILSSSQAESRSRVWGISRRTLVPEMESMTKNFLLTTGHFENMGATRG